MKKTILALVTAIVCAVSCDFLDVVPEGSPTQQDVYKTQTQAQTLLYTIYDFVPNLFHSQSMPDFCGGDDCLSSYYGSVRYFAWKSLVYATSQETSSNTYFDLWGTDQGRPTGYDSWRLYSAIRYAHNFLNNIATVPDITEENLKIWSGEAHFLIAYMHHTLLEYYGPVVIVDHEIDMNSSAAEVNVPRNTYDDCVNYIVSEYDKAIELLPDYWGKIEFGRAIKATAYAYKSRLLLYAASPLVNGNTEFYSDFTNKDGTHLINQKYDKEKWKRAMDAAKEAIEYVESNPQLGLTTSAAVGSSDFEQGRMNYTQVFTGDGQAAQWLNQQEYLFSLNVSGTITYMQKQFGVHGDSNYTMSGKNAFRGYNCPTVEVVEMYYTKNGLPWEDDPETKNIDPYEYDEAAGTVKMHLYKEPRFYATVGYDRGSYRFNGGTMTIQARAGEPHGFTKWSDEYQSYNGYYTQKWVNEQSKQKIAANGAWSIDTYIQYVYPYIRVAELYLNYAEAEFEYNGQLGDYGYSCLNKIRERCGLPTFQDSWAKAGGIPTGEKLRKIIRLERSNEFYLEGRRFHDIRRWKEAHTILQKTPKAWNIEGKTAAEFYTMGLMKEEDARVFKDRKFYWLAIPNSQMNINGQLVQNPGY